MAKLVGTISAIRDIPSEWKEQMFDLLTHYFDHIERDHFYRDLAQKNYAILLRDKDHSALRGFSTLQFIDLEYQGEPIKVIFSGDTIIDQAYWGTMELPKVWLKAIFSFREAESPKRWYWFLICSGYKTYRFLPVFFKEFYPRFDKPTPQVVKEMIHLFADYKFPGDYDPATGTLRFSHSRERLKQGVADITEDKLKNAHIRFFAEKNPHHAEGAELCCLCEVNEQNLTSAGKKLLAMGTGE
ncbi:hypothetical protein [Brevibacillus sp. H7]|uniref:hypothetical protein n=1 Tax=Brevibacillus sp. H7 TaxID=3349138 RepID=UPI00382DDFB5